MLSRRISAGCRYHGNRSLHAEADSPKQQNVILIKVAKLCAL